MQMVTEKDHSLDDTDQTELLLIIERLNQWN